MFTPIKNFITYIQKNASPNSIFGVNNSTEGSPKMETENIKIEAVTEAEAVNVEMATEPEVSKEINKEEEKCNRICIEKDDLLKDDLVEEKSICTQTKGDSCSNLKSFDKNNDILAARSTVSTAENSYEFEDEDDIESQIESSIMLKKPVRVTATNFSEILELRKSSTDNRSIVISHDYNRSGLACSTDDELEDFRHDPTEVLSTTLPPCRDQAADELCSVGSAAEALEGDLKTSHDVLTEDEEEVNKKENEEKEKGISDSDLEAEEEKGIETENEHNDIIGIEDEEEPFLDLDTFKSDRVIVLDEMDLNSSIASVDTNNTTDDPLAIACEEHDAFAAEELNLLNTSQNSQDDDTRTTTDEDLRWLKPDLEGTQPSCSNLRQRTDITSDIMPEKEERNGEGSDSGLGSETSALHTTTSITDTSHLSTSIASPSETLVHMKTKDSEQMLNSNVLRLITNAAPNDPPKPYRSNLKRRLEMDDVVNGSLSSTASALNDQSSLDGGVQKKPKRSINFDNVQVYYFPRQQGFGCVPSAGGCTLGMGARHVDFKILTLAEHAAELRRAHRMQLQEINPRGSSSDDSEESEEDYLSEGSGSDLDGESNGFLQPVSPKQRRALLKAAGIRKIDPSEKAECRNIRNSREVCGCACRDFCDPETCACSQSGIKCQVDRDMFPCGCSRDACGNAIGRVEFNPTRVRTHYIHTLMRLEMENRQQNPYSSAIVSSMQPTPSSYYQAHLQPQSNYSSGYASPAYNTASDIHQQTAASSYYQTQTPSTPNGLYGQPTSLEMAHNGSAGVAATSSHFAIDTLDASLFGGTTAAVPSYGELMPLPSYHYGNMQTQTSYNSYQNTPYINGNNNTTSLNASNTYSSCAVPSIPPFGTATTTEATGVYHSVSSLSSLEITTAPSCSVTNTSSLENDASSSFISLSTPLASSSRLSQINDLLQNNRNATTALVAVSESLQSEEGTEIKPDSPLCPAQANGNSLEQISSSLCSAIEAPHIDDDDKNSMVLEDLVSPIEPIACSTVTEDEHDSGADISRVTTPVTLPTSVSKTLTKSVEDSSLFSTEFLPETSLCDNGKVDTPLAVSLTPIEPSAIEVAAGN